jgi:hypothetical protein
MKNRIKASNQERLNNKPLVILGNSDKKQLSIEAKQWAREARKESKGWEKLLVF